MSTGIPYLDEAWSPVVGCTPAQPAHGGCDHCWSRALHEQRHRAYLAGKRLPAQYAEPFATVRCLPERLEQPFHWRKPRRIGVCFGADLFHESAADEFIDRVYAVMAACPQHTFLILSKRAERMARYVGGADAREVWNAVAMSGWWLSDTIYPVDGAADLIRRNPGCREWNGVLPLPNIIHGVTIENQAAADERLPWLLQTPGRKLISYEPALGPMDWPGRLHGISWLAMGCEAGPDRRLEKCRACGGSGEMVTPVRPREFTCCPDCDPNQFSGPGYQGTGYAAWAWARQTRDACQNAGVAFWLKQLPDHQGRVIHAPTLDGRQWLEVPR